MTTPISDINKLLANKAKRALEAELANIKHDLCISINALGTNYGSGDMPLYIDGPLYKPSTQNVVEALFRHYANHLLPAFTNQYVNKFINDVERVKEQLNQLEDPS